MVVGNCFGFVANRMLAYYMREAYLLLEEGASVPQIDKALTDFGMPVGPFGMQDIAGIDVGARIRQYLKSVGKTRAEGPQSEVPDRLFEMGRYGQKTGAGWYRYEPGSRTRIPDPLVDELAAEAAAKRGITRRAITDDEIIARITTALANEGARVLEDGFAIRASDIDVIYCHGFGFPRHRGGPMFYADTVGLPTVLDARARISRAVRRLLGAGAAARAARRRRARLSRRAARDRRSPTSRDCVRTSAGRRSAPATGSSSRRSASTRSPMRPAIISGFTSIAERAAGESPFGTTIAHGFLTLSLISALMRNAIVRRRPADGDQLRRSTACASSRRCRPARGSARASRWLSVHDVDGGVQATWNVTVEREGADKPCLVAEWLVRYYHGRWRRGSRR